MRRFRRSTPARLLLLVALLATAAPLFVAVHQLRKSRCFDFGAMDADFLGDPDDFSAPTAMSGPIRHEDGSVEVIDFYGRLSGRRAEIRLPYAASRSPLRLFLRCHRFGLEGVVSLTVNGEKLDDFVFARSSYPWGGLRAVVPQDVAERGPLAITLVTEGGDPAPPHLPADIGVGIDRVEVAPMSEGAFLWPPRGAFVALYAFLLAGLAFALVSGAGLGGAIVALAALLTLALAATARFPVEAGVALPRLAVLFAVAIAIQALLLRVSSLPKEDARFAGRLAALALVVHALVIFVPSHLPPDVPLHAKQVSWLRDVDFSYRGLTEYARSLSRDITSEAVLMETGNAPEELEPSELSYGAPYPPFFYLLAYALSPSTAELPFVLELLSVSFAALMLVLVFLIARAIWTEPGTARLAAVLFALEISVWHHANRGHAPGLFGALFVLAFLWTLVSYGGELESRRTLFGFTLLTAAVALCYTVALIQISIFTAVFAALLLLAPGARAPSFVPRVVLGFALGVGLAVAVFYGPYVLEALASTRSDGVILDRAAAYDPPARFYILRNQLRDTARLLANGHAIYVGLSAVGLVLLRRSSASTYHRRLLWAGVVTYVLLLALKDPALLPRIFLHAKEDLFYAPFACMLVALPASWLWVRKRLRPLVLAGLLGLVFLSVRDTLWNADTLHPQPLARRVEPAERDA